MASKSLALKASWPSRWVSTFADVMAPPRRFGRSSRGERAGAGLPGPFSHLSRPFRRLGGTNPTRTVARVTSWASGPRPRSNCAVASSSTSTATASKPRCPAAEDVPCSPTSFSSVAVRSPVRAAHGRLGTGRPCGGGKRAERGAVQTAARPGRRSSAGAGRDRTAAAPGDLRRRRGRSRGRPPGRDLHRRGTVGAGLGSCRNRLPRRHQAVPQRTGSALDRPVAAAPGGGPASRPGVLRRRRPRPGRPGTGPGRGTCQAADRARTISRDRAPHADGSARAARQRRRGSARLRAATSPAPRGLGIAPSPPVQDLHRRLLRESADG